MQSLHYKIHPSLLVPVDPSPLHNLVPRPIINTHILFKKDMGRKNPNSQASDQTSPRKARRIYSRKSSSSTCSSSTQSTLGPAHYSTQSEKSIQSTQSSDRNSSFGLNTSDVQRASMPSFAALKDNANLGKQGLEKKYRNLAPAPVTLRCVRTPESPNADVAMVVDKNGRRKILLPRPDSLAQSTTPPIQTPYDIPTDQASRSSFDPSQCAWHAIRDVAFVKDEKIKVSMEDLCALLRIRYAEIDPQMENVEECHVDAMDEFCKRQGKQMYEEKYPEFVKKEMEVDLRNMREVGETGG